MTEVEWLASVEPERMLYFLKDENRIRRNHEQCGNLQGVKKPRQAYLAVRRKPRLLAATCYRMCSGIQWPNFPADVYRDAAVVAERHADGSADEEEFLRGYAALWADLNAGHDKAGRDTPEYAEICAEEALRDPYSDAIDAFRLVIAWDLSSRESLSDLIRCVFGNPFRQVAFDPAWRTTAVVSLSQSIYTEWDFGRMPCLGDAIESAGCDDTDALDHCRSRTEHTRGCWVVDAILGSS